jgi:hypothetical protein
MLLFNKETPDTRGKRHGNRNPLWYLFADVIGEAISNPPAMRAI